MHVLAHIDLRRISVKSPNRQDCQPYSLYDSIDDRDMSAVRMQRALKLWSPQQVFPDSNLFFPHLHVYSQTIYDKIQLKYLTKTGNDGP